MSGFRNQLLTRLIVANSIVSAKGLFFYNGPPANGDLIAVIVAAAGTDNFSNAYPANIAALAPTSSGRTGRVYLASTGPNGSSDPALVLDTPTIVRPGQLLMHQASGSSRSFTELDGASLNAAGNVPILVLFGTSADGTVPLSALLAPFGNAPSTTAFFEVQGSITAVNANISSSGLGVVIGGGGVNCGVGNLVVPQVGAGLRVKEGSNAKQGRATLVGGSVVVANTAVTANSIVFVGYVTPSAHASACYCSSITPGTGFTITSANGLDTSVVGYQIFEPA